MGTDLAAGKRADNLDIDPAGAQRRNGMVNLRLDDRPPPGGPAGKQVVQGSVSSSNGAHPPSLSNRQTLLRQPPANMKPQTRMRVAQWTATAG